MGLGFDIDYQMCCEGIKKDEDTFEDGVGDIIDTMKEELNKYTDLEKRVLYRLLTGDLK